MKPLGSAPPPSSTTNPIYRGMQPQGSQPGPDSLAQLTESQVQQETSTESASSLSPSPSRVKRLSNAVEKTVDKLGRSLSGKTPPNSPPSSAHRRLFSINRKRKSKETDNADDMSPSSPYSESLSTSHSAVSEPAQGDDSPFITPPSPPLAPVRPSLTAFRGDGSIRAGTQALIQALQAIPWEADPDHDEEISHQEPITIDSDSEDEDAPQVELMASSIHTIYRPLARSRRMSTSRRPTIPEHPSSSEGEGEDPTASDGETDDEDFEATPTIPHSSKPLALRQSTLGRETSPETALPARMKLTRSRTGSMATVRIQRRTKLAEKLKQIFDLPGIEEVSSEMPCWLLRSVLLQGYMYLTNSYLCFFAHMPSREDQILKSGSLNKKAQRTKRWIKHWFVLKNDALSWYQSSSDPYFPHGIVDLRYAISCEPVGDRDFRLRTNQKTILLSADSIPSREEWVKSIKKVIFKAQNMGDSVKIAIPYSAILDVEKSAAMDFSETIEVKVFDKEPNFAIDSYFFAYFHDLSAALDQIRDAVRNQRSQVEHRQGLPEEVLDTTISKQLQDASIERAHSFPVPDKERDKLPLSSSSGFRFSSLLKPLQDTLSRPSVSADSTQEEFMHISRRPNSSFIPITTSPLSQPHLPGSESTTEAFKPPLPDHTYPPSNLARHPSLLHSDSDTPAASTWSVPNWLKGTRSLGLFGSGVSESTPTNIGVKEVYSGHRNPSRTSSGNAQEMAFSMLETAESSIDDDIVERFRTTFAFDQKETLLGYFTGYLFRLLPVYGKLYVSTNFFCFKSSGPLTARTRMALPIRDILATEKSKGTRFGHYGLIVIIKGHEEVFFEFGAEDRRDSFMMVLARQQEDVQKRLTSGEAPVPTPGKQEALILEELEQPSLEVDPVPAVQDGLAESLPAVMFTSASSTFLTFKPHRSLHFTMLTIGSRGDVQPYIALAKGLIAEGHKVKIATHGEFREWIESHGIEFGNVGGDPAELMRICVENGVFTVSFLKEGVQKFRGWLDDLLQSSWDVCQGTDVLIESPSAMGGYHIAEALGIPYFRAFTMTWTRTRAYPHAFAVPERKMGGSYNYMSYVIFDQVFWRAISGQVNRWRKNVLNLPSTSLDKMEPHKIPFLYNFSPFIVPPPLDWPEWIRVTGYWFLDDADVSAKKWSPPKDLVKFIDTAHKNAKKVVYIGFGSIVVSDPKSMTRSVIEAVVKSGVYAILSKGWSDRLQAPAGESSEIEEPLPPQIYPITSVPHDWLFQRIDAACHHGGAGTTGASLRAGIPTIIRPFFGDQFFWGDRVEALGVGTAVRKLTVDSLTEALILATTDQKQIDRAKLLGEHIRKEDGVATAIESIYRDLEYARSLIKRPANSSDDESDPEHGTIRRRRSLSADAGYSSNGSARGAPSEDWSVISSEPDEHRRGSFSEGKSSMKRNSLAAAVLSVLPDTFPGSPRRRTSSTGESSRPSQIPSS